VGTGKVEVENVHGSFEGRVQLERGDCSGERSRARLSRWKNENGIGEKTFKDGIEISHIGSLVLLNINYDIFKWP
jgi:hypothetical protein